MENKVVKKIGKYLVIFSFILFLIVLFINLFIVFFSSKTAYQEDTVEYIGMWAIPFFVSFGIGLVLFVFAFFSESIKHHQVKVSAFFIITIFSLSISGYLQYRAYNDYFSEPQHITDTLVSVDYQFRHLSTRTASRYYYFILETKTKGWDTRYFYESNSSEVLHDLTYFQQYLGKELIFTYSSYYNHLAYIQDPEGNYIYRASQLNLESQ